MTDASRVKRILHHSTKISAFAKRHAPRPARAKIASLVGELRKSLTALERFGPCSAKRSQKLYRHAARHARRALRGLTLAAHRLPKSAQRHWHKAHGDDRIVRMIRLLRPLMPHHAQLSLSFRRVGHCMDRHSSDARTSERMVVI